MARKSGSTGKLQLLSAGREPLREAKPLGRRQGEHPADLLQILGLEPGFGVRLAVVGKRAEAAGGLFSALGHRPIVSSLVNDRAGAGPPPSIRADLVGGARDEAAGFASLAWRLPGATLSAGGRYTWQRLDNAGAASAEDTAWNGFVGAAVPLPAGFQVTANLGTGLRFPTLSERYFTGTTGRGDIVANAGLDPERAVNADLGLAWFGDRLYLRGHLFRTEIDDYIERIRLPSGARTFVNRTRGAIDGIELEGTWQPAPGWTVGLAGHRIDGETDAGAPLADVPADRLDLTLAAGPAAGLAGGRLGFQLRAEQRAAVDDPGSGEMAIPGAFLLDAAATWRLADGLDLTLRGSNLTDETWFPSADELAVPAPGRGFGLSLAWTP